MKVVSPLLHPLPVRGGTQATGIRMSSSLLLSQRASSPRSPIPALCSQQEKHIQNVGLFQYRSDEKGRTTAAI